MNRRAFFAGSVGVGTALLSGQISRPPRARTISPYYGETYWAKGWEVAFSVIRANEQIRYLAVRVSPAADELVFPKTVLQILREAELLEPNAGNFQPLEVTNNGAIFWILSLGRRQQLWIKGGYIYRLGSWFARPPGDSVDVMQISAPAALLITFGPEVPTGRLL